MSLDGLFRIVRDVDHASRDMDLTKPNTLAGIWIFKLLSQKSYVWPAYGLANAILMDFKSKWVWPNLSKQKGSGFWPAFGLKCHQDGLQIQMDFTKPFQTERFWILASIWTQMPYWWTSNPNRFDRPFPSRKVLDFSQCLDSNAIKMDFKSKWIWQPLSKQKGSGFFLDLTKNLSSYFDYAVLPDESHGNGCEWSPQRFQWKETSTEEKGSQNNADIHGRLIFATSHWVKNLLIEQA